MLNENKLYILVYNFTIYIIVIYALIKKSKDQELFFCL